MSFLDFQKQVNAARNASEEQRVDLKTARQKANNLFRRRDQLLREIGVEARDRDERLAEIKRSEGEFGQAVGTGKAAYNRALVDEWATLHEFSQFTDPIENISALQDTYPILLLPLRLQMRFKTVQREGQTVNQLWVRVFPDDIAINTFESDLSETEVRNARSYWLARWAAGQDTAGQRGAWRSLASAHGSGRAYWLTNNYVPSNWTGEPNKAEGEILLTIGTDEPLADPELAAITTYWQEVWQAEKDGVRLSQAWNKLLTVISEERATSLIKNYKPANLNEPPPSGFTREKAVVRVAFVIFPKTDELEAKLHAWSQPPTTSILPERFVFLAYNGRELAMPPQLGNLIPPKLVLGPDPASAEGEDFRLASKDETEANPGIQEGDLIVSDELRWMFDFEEAVTKGMGFRIDLSPEQATGGFDRAFVLGLKLSADQNKGQVLLEELFAQHQSSRKGFSILKQGTPTNNTEEEASGYSWREDPDKSFDIYFDKSSEKLDPTDWFHKTDGRWLAEFLGINPTKLQAVENYYSLDISQAKAMQRALWPATMGHFMDSLMNPVFSPDVIELTRQFYTGFVSGRGSLPSIRVGKQPYGILPATDYTHLEWFRQRPRGLESFGAALTADPLNFLAKLYEILMDVDQTWTSLLSRVAYVGKTGDAHQTLLDIVGLHPDSVELYKRYANSLKQIHNVYNARGFAHEGLFRYFPTSYTSAADLLAKYGYRIDAEHPEPDILKKSFFKQNWALKGDRIDSVPNSEVDPIRIYTSGVPGKNYIGWLIEAAEESHDRLRLQAGFIDEKPPSALLYLLLYHALDLSYIDTSLKLHLSQGLLTASQVQQAYIEPDFIHIEETKETESRWKYLYTRDERITGDPDLFIGKYIAEHLNALEPAAVLQDVLAGLRQLENVPTAALERAMMEHIDTVSYRYDTWILGYSHLQLRYMRGLYDSSESQPVSGVYLGAYGWLEDVRPENKVLTPVELPDELKKVLDPEGDLVEDHSNAGYILAPSQNHAVTAAILRNGHLSNEDPEEKEELKIKLSSERVRQALQIIEGIQGGQSLSALLGYHFERGLHDRTDAEVDEFIFDLRNHFSLGAKKFKDTTPGEQDTEYESIDQIEAKNVIDGVAFLEHIEKTGKETYPYGLEDLPQDPMPTPDQIRAMDEEVQALKDLNDAVADVALAESVHQVVLGNFERAAATLETYSKGNFPPTPDVIQTPRSGTQLTHRVALQFKTGMTHNLGDPGVTPRMLAEPAIHGWLTGILPDMDEIVCVASYFDRVSNTDQESQISLHDLGLAHLDALYSLNLESDQAMSALDDLIIQHVLTASSLKPRLDKGIQIHYTRKLDDDKFTIFEVAPLIASLRTLLLKSKPLTAADVKLSNEASRESEKTVSLDSNRVQPLVAALTGIRTNALAGYINDLSAILATGQVDDIVDELDSLMSELSAIFTSASRFGPSQAGTGFIYQWHQGMCSQLRTKVEDLIVRWGNRRTEYETLRTEYLAQISSATPEELFAILQKAELKISTSATVPQPATPAAYFTIINDTKFVQFTNMLSNTISPKLNIYPLTDLIQGIQAMASQLLPFDSVGIDIDEQLKQVNIFANDLKVRAENLNKEIEQRATKATDLLGGVTGTADPVAKVELVRNAAKALFGDDFVIAPEFKVDTVQGTEWQNTLTQSNHSLRYLTSDLNIDFPMDDWLYGISRVREKLYHLENAILQMEGLLEFNGTTLNLVPSQFPYRVDDYWLGLQFPEKKPGTDDPFSIDEDKLLFTSIYTETFVPGKAQCGLLLDEWTEVIPARAETIGLTFHYDQPNSEPPQTLLLVTPSNFTKHWQWQDLVNTLHETLDMAKKRAVEPDHVDKTVYSRFLPPIVSLASPLPLTATLNLALNNQVLFAKAFKNE